MDILRRLSVPTGDILVVQGSQGKLEMLSLGDYGQAVNLNQHKQVLDGTPLMPLSEKWVITISTQYGCSVGCDFCDVPRVGPGRNASLSDLQGQILTGVLLHPEIQSTKRLNVHFARMGEPSYNPFVLDCAKWLKLHLDSEYNIHPVVSTMMPNNNIWLKTFIHNWMRIKNRVYGGNAGLQLSINSTDELQRGNMFNWKACRLDEIAQIMEGIVPTGRKITLNFAVANYTIEPEYLLRFFRPEWYVCKLTPMHKTKAALSIGLETHGDYTSPEPYLELEDKLKRAGYDVLVFIASNDEDSGRITCGNAILSGSMPHKFTKVE
jgi:23S rRNA (adenine2503-C2)-methyltransferase